MVPGKAFRKIPDVREAWEYKIDEVNTDIIVTRDGNSQNELDKIKIKIKFAIQKGRVVKALLKKEFVAGSRAEKMSVNIRA